MHRSGTSLLAGALERCGLWLGDVRGSGRHNALGYYENRSIQRLHDQALALCGGSWSRPPARVDVHPRLREQMEWHAERLARRRPCGLKDPRLLLFLQAWVDVVPEPLRLVASFRHPLEAAASLTRRNGLTTDHALALWLHYNRELVGWHRRQPFPIVEYQMADPAAYCAAVAATATALGLSSHLGQLLCFANPGLAHHRADAAEVPVEHRAVWDYLQAHRVQVSAPADVPRIAGAVREMGFRAARASRR